MKITAISYQKVFPLAQFVNERIGVEASVDIDDDVDECMKMLKGTVETWHKQLNPNLAPLTDFNTGQPEAIDPHAALRLQQLIIGATTTEELETYYPDTEKYGLTGTWDKKLKSLKE